MTSAAHDAFVALLPSGGATPTVLPDAASMKAMRMADAALPLNTPSDMVCSEVAIGDRRAYWVGPRDLQPTRTVLYLHGGGYIFLSARHFIPVAAAVARATDARCLLLDYRKAPEAPFPAALEDSEAAYAWLITQGVDPDEIAIAGDSAGGGLALATALAIRERGLPAPAACAVVSPWTDLTISGDSVDTRDDPVVGGDSLRMMARTYLAGADPLDPRASPLFADLTGLPPILILVGTRESLLADSRRFATEAQAAAIEIRLIEFRDVAHMWIFYDPAMPEAVDAFVAIGRFLKEKVRVGGPIVRSTD